jgi:hypothetical protein
MQLCNQGWREFKWNNMRTSNDETWAQVNVGGVVGREGIEPKWSLGFGLVELDVWQECWWWANLWLVNWHLQVG